MNVDDLEIDFLNELSPKSIHKRRFSFDINVNGLKSDFFEMLNEVRHNRLDSISLLYHGEDGRYNSLNTSGLVDYLDHLYDYSFSEDRFRTVLKYEIFRYLNDNDDFDVESLVGKNIQLCRKNEGRKEFIEDDAIPLGVFEFSDEEKLFIKKYI